MISTLESAIGGIVFPYRERHGRYWQYFDDKGTRFAGCNEIDSRLNLEATAATSLSMKSISKIPDPVQIEDTLGWIINNLDRLATGALVAAGIVGVMLVMRWIGRRILADDPEIKGWKGIVGRVLAKTTVLFMVAAAIEIVCSYAAIPIKLARLADMLFIIAAALQTAIWAREIIIGVIRGRVGEDPGASTLGNAMSLIRVLVSVAVFAIAIIVILDNLGVNVTALVAGLGIGGIAIGLAAQGIFSDLFAALAIVFDRPFRRGDLIRYGGAAGSVGTVEKIGLKTTRIRSVSGEQLVMSNTKLLEQELTNVTELKVRRTWMPFGLIYQTSPDVIERLPEILDEAVKPIKTCRLVRATANQFGPSSIDCELVYDDRSTDADTLARHKSAIIIAILRVFAREKIELAYPTQTTFTAAPDGTMVMPYATVQPVIRVEEEPEKQG
jgi:small-conductance mechanosensitive channel